MKYDIVVQLYTPAIPGRPVSGYLLPAPAEKDLEDIIAARDEFQSYAPSGLYKYVTLFTREKTALVSENVITASEQEVTISGDVLKNSVIVTQIVEVAE